MGVAAIAVGLVLVIRSSSEDHAEIDTDPVLTGARLEANASDPKS